MELSFAQQRLWFIDQMEPGTSLYNIAGGVRLEGELDVEALERSINEIERRHETLRTRVETRGGKGVQVIDEWEYRRLSVIDLSGLDEENREGEARRISEEEGAEGFELSAGRMMRVKVIRKEASEHELIYTMHHIISDGWSMGVVVKEVGELYESYRRGEESRLGELEIQYADYAAWQRGWLKGEVLEEQMRYWREQLAGELGVIELPVKRADENESRARGGRERVEVGVELSEKLREMSREQGVTMYMLMLAGFKVLLHRYSGQRDIIVGSPIAGRNRQGSGRADRVLRKHSGAEDGGQGRREIRGGARASERSSAWSIRASGSAV